MKTNGREDLVSMFSLDSVVYMKMHVANHITRYFVTPRGNSMELP